MMFDARDPKLEAESRQKNGAELAHTPLVNLLIEKYYPNSSTNVCTQCEHAIRRHLTMLEKSYPDLEELRGKRILDLACGARSYESKFKEAYDPWMPRLLLELGAIPVGVDLLPQQDELFESYQIDLSQLDALKVFASHSFDGIHMDGFPNIPACDAFLERGISWPKFKAHMEEELQRLVKPTGMIIQGFNEECEKFVSRYTSGKLIGCPDDEL